MVRVVASRVARAPDRGRWPRRVARAESRLGRGAVVGWAVVGLAAVGVGAWSAGSASAEGRAEVARDGTENRLAREKSPYLLQHARNPVDWYPWGEEAFEKARKERKPILLSIGYSTCHWCHVMERESFEDDEIAAFLNTHFVAIKVDREERPDVDAVYMAAVQALSQRGGWPLTAFLTPDGRPFFGGTYFPPQRFLEVLRQIRKVWTENRDAVDQVAARLTEHLARSATRSTESSKLDDGLSAGVFEYLQIAHDGEHGGFGGPPAWSPKFPRTSTLDFLLRYSARTGSAEAREMVERTLDHMIRGGIRDHLAGGFHRYSTDRRWLVPHFEKMLYDNALIPRTLIEAWQATGEERYLEVARETLDWVLGALRSREGGFHSALDADTDGVEGLTYVWTRAEILAVLGESRGELFCEYYGVTEEGNFHEGPERSNVLHVALADGVEGLAKGKGRDPEALEQELEEGRRTLLAARGKRPQPFLDDKVLVSWNGLAISAFARAAQVTREPRYLEAARGAASFVLERMVSAETGRLQRRYRDGDVDIDGFLDDHAFLIEGLLDLWEADFDRRWLEAAVRLSRHLVALFQDEDGSFFSTAGHHEALIVRQKDFYDGALPAGNSVAVLDLLRLHALTLDEQLGEAADRAINAAAGLVRKGPHSHPQLACAVEFRLAVPLEIIIVGEFADETTVSMLAAVRRRFEPAKVVAHAESREAAEALGSLVPWVAGKLPIGGRPTAFVCRERVCDLPAGGLDELRSRLDSARKRTVGDSGGGS